MKWERIEAQRHDLDRQSLDDFEVCLLVMTVSVRCVLQNLDAVCNGVVIYISIRRANCDQ